MKYTVTEDELESVRKALQRVSFVRQLTLCAIGDNNIQLDAADMAAFLDDFIEPLDAFVEAVETESRRAFDLPGAVSVGMEHFRWLVSALRIGGAALNDTAMVADFDASLKSGAEQNADFAATYAAWREVLDDTDQVRLNKIVDDAIASGKLVAAQRDWAIAKGRKDLNGLANYISEVSAESAPRRKPRGA